MTATASDSDGTISKVEFFNGATLLATDTTSPYSYTWAGVAGSASSYSLKARATDNLGMTTDSSVSSITVNALPTVALTAPTTGSSYAAPASITLTATASDSDGSVGKVEFYNGATLLGTATTAPYSHTWLNVPGSSTNYLLKARAIDNRGAITDSSVTSVTVNALPTVSLSRSPSAAVMTSPASATLTATPADSDGSISKVEFYRGTTLLGTYTTTPYTHSLSSLPNGSYSYTAKAYDNRGAVTTSAANALTVTTAPTVSLTAPTNGASYTAGANITLTATASDDGSISKVEFFNGSTLLGTATTAPYSYTWQNVPGSASAYSLKARATDNVGVTTDSSLSSITVNAIPAVSLTRSPTSASIVSPASITLTATASDSDGSISKVEFYRGATLLGTATSTPYTQSVSGLTNGNYNFTAKAYDNRGAGTVSAANALTVTVPASGPTSITRHYVYNAYQQLCKVIEPETGSTVTKYDNAGNVLWTAAGLDLPDTTLCNAGPLSYDSGRRVDRVYDARNRVTSLIFPDGLGNTTYTYHPDGKLASLSTDNGGSNIVTTSYGYNHRGLTTRESMVWGSISWPIDYYYNANGHLSSQVWHGLTVDYAPNALGQPTQAGIYATNVSYYPNGAIKHFTYGNGIDHDLTQNTRGLPDVSRDAYGTTEYLDDGYVYDANGNVAAIIDGLSTSGGRGDRTMSHDGLDRLTAVASPMFGASGASYQYDVLDNITRVKTGGAAARDHWYCYDNNHRLTNVKTGDCGGSTVIGLGYDVQGNLSNKNGVSYAFDYGNRLRSTGGNSASSYVYDGHGRRVRDYTTASKYSQYSQSGQLTQTSDARAGVFSEYVYLGGSLVAIRERTGTAGSYVYTTKYQHTDALGSPVAVTNDSRAEVERNEYEPYGLDLTGVKDGPGYTGHVSDATTGLSYMQQRYYDPGIARFLSVDPVTADGNSGGNFNRYWYGNNNPYRFTDPDGRAAVQAIEGAALGCAIYSPCRNAVIRWGGAIIAGMAGAWAGSHGNVLPIAQQSEESQGDSPSIPGGLVGTQDSGSRQQGERVNNGPLAPVNGGTGDAGTDFEHLTGGKSGPAPEGLRLPEGSQVGENGIIYRPGSDTSGPRIDIPANGEKPHETLHYPAPKEPTP